VKIACVYVRNKISYSAYSFNHESIQKLAISMVTLHIPTFCSTHAHPHIHTRTDIPIQANCGSCRGFESTASSQSRLDLRGRRIGSHLGPIPVVRPQASGEMSMASFHSTASVCMYSDTTCVNFRGATNVFNRPTVLVWVAHILL
jgi:hypothetical protein